MLSACNVIPDEVLSRFKGGVHLLYVNTFFRKSSDRTEKAGCLLLQEFFNRLLRHSGSTDYDDLIELSWEKFTNKYTRLKQPEQRKESIIAKAESHINRLQTMNIIGKSNGSVYSYADKHPHLSLDFSDPNVQVSDI
jgi:hypothetical protein